MAKAMNALSKRRMHKPPLTTLNGKHRQVLSLLVHGLDHADANRPDVPVGRPLSAPEIAETLGCRRSYIRDLLSDPLFKTEMAKAVADARAALHDARNPRRAIERAALRRGELPETREPQRH
jgi:hypothetical protein